MTGEPQILPRDQPDSDDAEALALIREGIADMLAGRTVPADEVFGEIRRDFGLSE